MDLTILIDTSESIIDDDPYGKPLHNWKRVVSLVKGLVNDLPISGEEATRTKVQVLTYSNETHLVSHLDQFQTAYDIINHLDSNLKHTGGEEICKTRDKNLLIIRRENSEHERSANELNPFSLKGMAALLCSVELH